MTTTRGEPANARSRLVADIIAQFRTAVRDLRCVSSQRMHEGGLTVGNLHLTSMLERHGPMPMNRIADLLDVSMSAATGIIDRLEERRLVERVRVPDDRRVVLVQLTDHGRQVLQDVEVLKEALLEKILTRLESKQLQAFAGVLGDMRGIIAELAITEPDLFAHHHPHVQGRRD